MKVLLNQNNILKVVDVEGDDKYFWSNDSEELGECHYLNEIEPLDITFKSKEVVSDFFNHFLYFAIDDADNIYGRGVFDYGKLIDHKGGWWREIECKDQRKHWFKKGSSVISYSETLHGLRPWTKDYLPNEYLTFPTNHFKLIEIPESREDVLIIGAKLVIVRVGLINRFNAEPYVIVSLNENNEDVLLMVQNGYKIIKPDDTEIMFYCDVNLK